MISYMFIMNLTIVYISMSGVDMISDGNMKGFGQGREGTGKNIIG